MIRITTQAELTAARVWGVEPQQAAQAIQHVLDHGEGRAAADGAVFYRLGVIEGEEWVVRVQREEARRCTAKRSRDAVRAFKAARAI